MGHRSDKSAIPILMLVVMLMIIAMIPPGSTAVEPHPTGETNGVKEAQSFVPVLLYHHVQAEPVPGNGAVITSDEFEWQMRWLDENGYQALTIQQFADWLLRSGELPGRPVLITFDDGYASNYTVAAPILSKYDLCAAVFVITGGIGADGGAFGKVSWEQMQSAVEASLLEFHAHSHEGHEFDDGVARLIAWDRDRIARDSLTLQNGFAANGLPIPTAYAYPYGVYDQEVIDVLKEQSYEVAFTIEPGVVCRGDAPYELKRQIVAPGMTPGQFARLLDAD